MRSFRSWGSLSLLLLPVLIAGCQGLAWPPAVSPERPEPVPDSEPLGEAAPAMPGLSGRVIALDPGHGGRWPGAVAPSNQLRESDVNLAVARRLHTVLEEAGAEPLLLRTGDYALDPSSLGADLAARPAMANERNADVFISIHHNAELVDAPQRDDLEVYYKLGDDGPSLDLGQALMTALADRFRPEASRKRLLPGNYRVLRESEMPAVLLESAYLTHEPSARALEAPETLDRQAIALARGLEAYFAADPPRAVASEITADGAHDSAVVSFDRGLPIDSLTVTAEVNGASAEGRVASGDGGFRWTFREPLPNGDLDIAFTGRNMHGAAFVHEETARVDRPGASVHVTQTPERVSREGSGGVRFTAHVRDRHGLPVADGTPVAWRGQTAETHEGAARFYVDAAVAPETLAFSAGGASHETAFNEGAQAWTSVSIRDGSGEPVAGAQVRGSGGEILAVTDPEGWAAFPAGEASRITVDATGFEPQTASLSNPHGRVTLEPVSGGALHGKVIALDPAFGGRMLGAVGPSGNRAADVNLAVARRLAALLREAGATPVLTRGGDQEVTDLERILGAEAENPDLFVRVSFGESEAHPQRAVEDPYAPVASRAFIAHYPGSTGGSRLARLLGRQLGIAEFMESHTYVLQQTSCPAVIVQPADLGNREAERRYRSADAQREIAEAMYQGLAAYFQ